MKVSVSLPADDLAYLDAYARKRGLGSRSAAVHQAVGLLRASELGAAYEQAWAEWVTSDDAEVWDAVSADGVGRCAAARSTGSISNQFAGLNRTSAGRP